MVFCPSLPPSLFSFCPSSLPFPPSPISLFSLQQYFALRSQAIQSLKETGPHPYPHKFAVTMSLTDFIEQFKDLKEGEQLQDQSISLAGEKRE